MVPEESIRAPQGPIRRWGGKERWREMGSMRQEKWYRGGARVDFYEHGRVPEDELIGSRSPK